MSKPQSLSLSFFLAALVLTLDQLSKHWVVANIAPGDMWQPFPAIGRYFRIVHSSNTGVAFGMFQGGGSLFTFVAAAAIVGIIAYVFTQNDTSWLTSISFGLMLGGAAGNLWDRLSYGFVIDFVDVRYSDTLVWPTFNVADSTLIVGVIVLFIALWGQEVSSDHDSSPTLESGEPVP